MGTSRAYSLTAFWDSWREETGLCNSSSSRFCSNEILHFTKSQSCSGGTVSVSPVEFCIRM
ncbi:hypothetical protein EYF80_029821 [Liparis tanakae]|uniref:Uncharacterized protein n=1 Tax=Liparis tanakae TaxID=230148 RepID=A0A4Z2H2H9_9TELE|nr:hypothetical protein EYF80_029821 [Liparis tanakae]